MLNPFGWINCQRTDEENIDIIRNGFDVDGPPEIPAIDQVWKQLINPKVCDDDWYTELNIILQDPQWLPNFRAAVFKGQYKDATGIFYGGKRPCWSRGILQRQFRAIHNYETCRNLSIIDIHSGLGGFGELTLISTERRKKYIEKLRNWFGNRIMLINKGQNQIVNAVSTDLMSSIPELLPNTSVSQFAVEIGTESFETSFPAFVAWNRLRQDYSTRVLASLPVDNKVTDKVKMGMSLKARFAHIFYPLIKTEEWKTAAWYNFISVWKSVVVGIDSK